MVQKTARLTVILSLVNRLRKIDNLHILLSCRSFEFNHDIRLTALKPDSVTLQDPPLAALEAVLSAVNVDWKAWPADARELLRRPQYLNFFIQHLSQDKLP